MGSVVIIIVLIDRKNESAGKSQEDVLGMMAFRNASERKFPLKSGLNLLQCYNFSYLPIFPSKFVLIPPPQKRYRKLARKAQ